MKRIISSLLVASMLATSVPSFADPPMPPVPALQPNEAPVGSVISPMKKGQVAPFTGLLLSPSAVADIIVQLQNAQNETDIQVKRAVETQKAQDQLVIDNQNSAYQYLKTTSDLIIKNQDAKIAALTKKIVEEEKSKPNLPLWIGGGFLGGVVVSVLTVFAIGRATR